MKTNKSVYLTFTMSEEEFRELCEDYRGLCTSCGEERDANIEPDAERVKCEHCGKKTVCGADVLLITDRIIFSEEA
jgi:hypothetical protein